MHGYGEFYWKNEKKYLGYYEKDKKHGFGILYWAYTNVRVYVGFWKNGRQDGVGKYINKSIARYGLWHKGERIKWLNNEKEAIDCLLKNQIQFEKFFKYDIGEIINFLS